MYKYAGIIINSDSTQLDRIFTYSIPLNLIGEIGIGMRVKVPFGLGNRKLDGFVIELYEACADFNKIKEIIEVCDSFPVLRKEDILLIEEMRRRYLCTYLECIKIMIPPGITKGMKIKTSDKIYLSGSLTEKYIKEPYISIYNLIKDNNGLYARSELSKKFNISLSSINTMLKHGFLTQSREAIQRVSGREYEGYEEKNLNIEQRTAVDKVLYSNEKKFLIHGVTGSGKTEVYMNLVQYMLNIGKESIILVPEISLTPQMVERFKGRFGKDIAVFHSRLSDGQRFDEWIRVKNKEVKVAIGARSAIFLPFDNLGIVIIDEEHEGSYKSDSDPKYNAREIAEMKSNLEGCKILLGSATPSIESYYKCINKDYELITLKNRADGALMPEVETIDMREELQNGNKSMFSRKLNEEILNCLQKGEQVILFLNRRGFSTFVSCRKCGYVFKCTKCDISLTYHSDKQILECHYCGEKMKLVHNCPECGSKYVKYFGVGTEKVEAEVKRSFPEAKVLRMDFDTTRTKDAYERIYETFKNGRANVLIGTQMIAKGLDFKNVTLVGVIAADLSLHIPDFRAAERTYQLITQVSGRAGRGEKKGKVIIQTYNPDDYSLKYSTENNYNGFYEHEISIRNDMNYPPFSSILSITLTSEEENQLIKTADKIGIMLKNQFNETSEVSVLGPCPCTISKIKNSFRWQILVKGEISTAVAMEVKNITHNCVKESNAVIRVSLDTNPNSLL